jgi:hypothetical protein
MSKIPRARRSRRLSDRIPCIHNTRPHIMYVFVHVPASQLASEKKGPRRIQMRPSPEPVAHPCAPFGQKKPRGKNYIPTCLISNAENAKLHAKLSSQWGRERCKMGRRSSWYRFAAAIRNVHTVLQFSVDVHEAPFVFPLFAIRIVCNLPRLVEGGEPVMG